MEIWKPIQGSDGIYEVSNMGRVRSVDRHITRKNGIVYFCKGRILKEIELETGYRYVNLYINGKQEHCYIHRLVATEFIENPDGFPQVNHKDENPRNNNVSNLEWCTGKYNSNYGTHPYKIKKCRIRGNQARAVILLSSQALCIFKSVGEAARFTGYSSATISDNCKAGKVVNGILYQYLDDCEFLVQSYGMHAE